jgi:hypothetical protein
MDKVGTGATARKAAPDDWWRPRDTVQVGALYEPGGQYQEGGSWAGRVGSSLGGTLAGRG